MKKKLIGIFVCTLLIGTAVLPVSGNVFMERTSKPTFTGDTLYVGGSGPNNYTSIQKAINDAEIWDTVFVYDDSSPYYENVVVNKSIQLIGEDKHTTVIDGKEMEEAVVHINVDGVTVQGFTIQNGSSQTSPNYGIEIISDNNIIEDNIIVDNCFGIQIGKIPHIYSYNNIIKNNIIKNNEHIGLSLAFAFNNVISGNFVSSNGDQGILLNYESSNNLITYNDVSHHGHSGIYINGNNNTIRLNNVINNSMGIWFLYSIKNQVLENNIYNNGKDAEINVAMSALIRHMWSHRWDGNYWGKPKILPAVIIGRLYVLRIPLFAFDWRPAQEPYDIGV